MPDDLEADVKDGKESLKLMENPQFSEAITMIKASLIEAFEYSQFKDREERDEIWRKLQSLNAITDQLQTFIDTGRLAEQTLMERIKEKVF